MTLTRRGFLGSLVAALAGGLAAQAIPRELYEDCPIRSIHGGLPRFEELYHELSRMAFEDFRFLVKGDKQLVRTSPDWEPHRGLVIGERGLSEEIHILFEPDAFEHATYMQAYTKSVYPAVEYLATRVNDGGYLAFGELGIPMGCYCKRWSDPMRGVSMRTVAQYQINERTGESEPLMRFDVLVG